MEYTKQQLNEMQEYVVGQLKTISINHTWPKEERVLNLLLVMLADQRIESPYINNANLGGEDGKD